MVVSTILTVLTLEEEGLYYLCGRIKGTDKLHSYCAKVQPIFCFVIARSQENLPLGFPARSDTNRAVQIGV